jgi:hypothetical protein
MLVVDIIREARYAYDLAQIQDVPYDTKGEAKWAANNPISPHRGPQEGRYLNLMLRGLKPLTWLFNDSVHRKHLKKFMPYIKQGVFTMIKMPEYVFITVPGEEWRARAFVKLLDKSDEVFMEKPGESPDDRKQRIRMYHARLGLLLGIPRDSIRYFINNMPI